MKGVLSIIGAVAVDMGILTTPQLHWMVLARNSGLKASESGYLEQISSSFRLVNVIAHFIRNHIQCVIVNG